MSEPSEQAEAAAQEMGELALERAAVTGRPVVVTGWTSTGRAKVRDVDLDGSLVDRGSVPIGPIWP